MFESKILDVGGPVHMLDFGGDGPLMLLLHGLGGSSRNWIEVADAFTGTHRVIAHDLSGFGLTPPNDRGASIEANAGLVVDLIHRLGHDSATLVGNSMGGLVALVTAYTAPRVVDRLVLVSPVLPVVSWRSTDAEVFVKLAGPLLPGVGASAIRLYRRTHSPEEETTETLAMVTADPGAVSEEMRIAMIETNRIRRGLDWAIPAFLEADRSMARYVLRRGRMKHLVHRIAAPTLVLHGDRDRFVPINCAHWVAAERPDWDFVALENVGHVPMIEAPERLTALVSRWLERHQSGLIAPVDTN